MGTNTPHASAMLDVTSSNKGMLAPRMTSALRTGIVSPAKGLLVYDTDLNGLYHYNGSAWAPVGGGGGAFTLPYEASVGLNNAAFKITNSGFGSAIQAVTTHEFGFALQASNSTNYGYSVYAYSQAPYAIGVYASVDSSTGVKAVSANGIGVHAISTDSIAVRAAIIKGSNADPALLATHAGVGNAIEGSSNTGTGVKGSTNSVLTSQAGVYGINNSGSSGYGVLGVANTIGAVGVQGNSNNGTGVYGNTNNGTGVYGNSGTGTSIYGYSSASGIALRGQSATGYGLQVSGNVRLSGGNTNPVPGAVLTTTDGIGNAVWKQNAIGFKAYAPYSGLLGFPSNVSSRKVHFGSKQYDFGSNFTPTTSSSPTSAMSTFEVPVPGLYHFDLSINVTLDDTYDDFEVCYAYIRLLRDGVDYPLLFVTTECCNANLGYEAGLNGSTDAQLQTGDKVFVIFYQRNDDDAVGKLVGGMETHFAGHLVFAQ